MTLRELRLSREMTLDELSRKTGLAKPVLIRYETGACLVENMTLRTAQKYSTVFGLSALDLLKLEPSPPLPPEERPVKPRTRNDTGKPYPQTFP